MKALFLFLFLSGCMSSVHVEDLGGTAPEFTSYIEEVERSCNVQVGSRITFKTLPEGTLGRCYRTSNVIYINPNHWYTLTEDEKEFIVWHEIGHCVFHRGHENDFTTLGEFTNVPRSMMYEHMFGYSIVYKQFKDYYKRELCGANI